MKLGIAHPDILLKQLTSEQIAEWAVFFSIEPDPDQRADFISAQNLALNANVNRPKDTEPFDVYDFMPWLDKPAKVEKEMTPEEAAVALQAMFGKKET